MKTRPESKNRPIDPRALLRAALAERCARNPNYSLRAFARSSGISHTVLSLVLSGKRRLSRKGALKLADYLDLDPSGRAALTRACAGKGPAGEDRRELTLDAFEAISDWYHYAILSALELPGARFEARWLGARLGIPILKAKLAMERLERLGLVERGEDGSWRQSGSANCARYPAHLPQKAQRNTQASLRLWALPGFEKPISADRARARAAQAPGTGRRAEG